MTRKKRDSSLTLSLCFILLSLVLSGRAAADTLEATEHQITSSYLDETEPTLSENIVVYTQIQPDGRGDICYQPLSNGAPSGSPVFVTNTPGTDEELNDVSGDYIVFTSSTDGIVVFRISDAATWSFGDWLYVNDPHIYGEWVVWLDTGQVMLYNLNDLGSAVPPQPISGIPASMLEIGDRFAVWVESNDIVVWDLASATSTTIGSGDSDISPVTSGAWVAWMASVGPTWIEAMNMDTNEHRVVVDNGSLNLRPSIHGDLIVWESNIACNYDIWVYRLSTGESFQVTTDSLDQQLGDVYGNFVAYVDDRGLNKDVFISRLEFISGIQEIPTEGVHADAFARHQDSSDGPIVANDSETAEAQAAVQTADWDRVSSIARAVMASDLLDSRSELDSASPSSPNPIREDIEANSAASRMTNWVATTSDPEVTTADIDVSVSIEGFLETGDFSGPPQVRCEVFAEVFFRACSYWGLDPARTLVFEAAARVDATIGLSTSGPWGGDFTPSGSGWWADYSGSFPAAFTVPTNEMFGWEVSLGTEVHAKAPLGLAATADFRRTGSFKLSTSTPGVTLTADACPLDPLKTEPGICGCGVPDTDTDGDWVADCIDNCLIDFNPVPVCNDDFDCLGPGNSCNLETGYCATQNDNDGDSDGDICDLDDDNDGVDDTSDNCPFTPNFGQLDDDYDGLGNACDFVFNNDGPLGHIEEVAINAAEIIGSIDVPGGNGLINNLLGNGGVVHKVAIAISEYDSGAIDEATYVESLQEALEKLSAFDNQLAAKIGNGQIVEPEASQLFAASAEIRATIENLIANAGG